jgi:hypothetical protein
MSNTPKPSLAEEFITKVNAAVASTQAIKEEVGKKLFRLP